jgi:hypothetical protein
VATLLEELRARRIVCPPLSAIERLAGSVRAHAQRQLWRRLADGLTDQQRQSPDNLLEVRVGGGQKHAGVVAADRLCSYDGQFSKADRTTDPGSRTRRRARARHACPPESLAQTRPRGRAEYRAALGGARAAAALRYTHGPGAGTLGH